MKKMTKTPAQVVNEVFPSCHELMNDDKYGVHHLLHPIQKFAFSNSQEWEGVAMAVNNMLFHMFDKGLYDSYAFNKNGKGSAHILPAHGDPIEVNFEEFQAIIKIMMIFNMGLVKPTSKQYDAYMNFKISDSRIYKILD